MLTTIDRADPRVEARSTTLLRYAHTSVRLLHAQVGARGERSKRREEEKSGCRTQGRKTEKTGRQEERTAEASLVEMGDAPT